MPRVLRRTLAAMSDDDDTPPAAAVAAPEASKGWSKQDWRMLVITIGGTLAANIVTVILVGGALAFVHLSKTSGAAESRLLVVTLGVMGLGLVVIVVGTVFLRLRDDAETGLLGIVGTLSWWYGWLVIVTGCLMELIAVMILIGLAAGVK
jgi:hypothetical protein